jgi:hypothetical protein
VTLVAIKQAIEQLPEPERLQLLQWLDEREQLAWDAELEQDFAPGGRGASLVDRVKRDIHDDYESLLQSL